MEGLDMVAEKPPTKLTSIGQGIGYTINDKGILLIKVDLKKDFGNTKGGNLRIASTLGNKNLNGDFTDVAVGLNIYKKVNQ